MDVTNAVCAACQRPIDSFAKLCPFCGANPATGVKNVDTQALLNEVFHAREVSTSESVMEYARHRQGVVITVGVIVVFLALAALHQFVTARNAREVTDAPPVPLTELTDLSAAPRERAVKMPEIAFPYEGRPQAMQTFIVEKGALTPPEVVAEQQAAAVKAAEAAAARAPRTIAVVPPQQPVGAPFRPAPVNPPQPQALSPRPQQQ